jgi:hypothetical protein
MTTSNNFISPAGLAMPSGNLASRRGSQGIKPLTIDSLKEAGPGDNGVPTPRTSRGHLLAGLRTAPKSATAATFGPLSPSVTGPQQFNRTGYNASQEAYNPPKSAYPRYGAQQNLFQQPAAQQQVQQQVQQPPQQQQQQHHHQQRQQQQMGQHYTVDQVLAPPELGFDEQLQEHMDPNLYAQLVATNMYLAQQQQRLQQQLRSVQAAAQQFQHMNLNNPQLTQQQLAIYEQQQQIRNMQQQLSVQTQNQQMMNQGQVYYNPMTGQYYVDNSTAAAQVASPYAEQPMTPIYSAQQQAQQHSQLHQLQQQQGTPRVQVSPPPETQAQAQNNGFRSNSPPKRYESPVEVTPLPPPSANAFRRNNKKQLPPLAPVNSALAAAMSSEDTPRSAGPRSAIFPTGSYGPGQARAGEHPVRQPRGPPSRDELKAKPTAKHEGSKNFASRTRRSAVDNLVRAGLIRRKGTGSSTGSMSPVSETAEDAASTPITDNESDSGRSGSGSLAGEMEGNSSCQTSTTGSWGAIGSDRPSSRQKGRRSIDSLGSMSSTCESDSNSFAEVFKKGALRAAKAESSDGQRKSRLVLTSIEKRRAAPAM